MANPNPKRENLTRMGANYGNKGGTGPKPSKLKAALAELSKKSVEKLLERIDAGEELTNADLMRGGELGAKYTIGQKIVFERTSAAQFESLAAMTAEFIPQERIDDWLLQAHSILMTSSDECEQPLSEDTNEDSDD